MESVEPDFLSALEGVQLAVRAGEDDTARAILDRVFWRGPRGKTLAVAQAFERILDGRAAVRELVLELVIEEAPELSTPAPPPESAPGSPATAPQAGPLGPRRFRRLSISARNSGDVALALAPGPGMLHVEHERLDARAAVQTSSEAKGFEHLATLHLAPGASTSVPLSVFFLELQPGALAERLAFRFDLRAGTITRGGRELPAMRCAVAPAEARALSEPLSARGPSTAGELLELVEGGRVRMDVALDLALRLPIGEEAGVLDALARLAPELPETDLKELVPSLRWLSRRSEPGGDPGLWRDWLRHRLRTPDADRGRLVPPPPISPG